MIAFLTKIKSSVFLFGVFLNTLPTKNNKKNDYVVMAHLYISDIFKIFHNFEASRLKLWQIVRTYDPIEFAQFLYLLENVVKSGKRECVELDERMLKEFCNYQYNSSTEVDECENVDYIIPIADKPTLRLERVSLANGDIFWNDNTNESNAYGRDDIRRHSMDMKITEIMHNIRVLNTRQITNPYERILQHNLGSTFYHKLLIIIQNCLFMDSLQTDRNELSGGSSEASIVTKFLEYYTILQQKQFHDGDARNLRFLIIPPPKRIIDISTINKRCYIHQPLYQGFHVVVYSSSTETKIFNRFGELHFNLGYSLRSTKNCTFEAVILPVDARNNARSWRYWSYKKKFIIYIVDVYRLEQTILTNVPFVERLKYIDAIKQHNAETSNILLRKIPTKLNDWSTIEERYLKNKDIFDPIVGVILRKPSDKLKTPALAYRFNVTCCFDLLHTQIVDIPNVDSLKSLKIQNMHINFEMADYRTTCIAYGHCAKYIYLCEYNRNIHQFVHFARIYRLPYEFEELNYKPETVYIINNQTVPKGILYLRVYYDVSFNVLGYDSKMTDCRYNVPYRNSLFANLRKHNIMLELN